MAANDRKPVNIEFIGEWSEYYQLVQGGNEILKILVWEGGFWEDDKTIRPVVQFKGQRFGMAQKTAAPETDIMDMVNHGKEFRRYQDTSERKWPLYDYNVLKPLISEPNIIGKKAIGIMDTAIPKRLFDLFKKKKE